MASKFDLFNEPVAVDSAKPSKFAQFDDAPAKPVQDFSAGAAAGAALSGAVAKQPEPQQVITKADTAAQHGLQGATLGFGDEAAALIDTGVSKVPGLRDFAQLLHDVKQPRIDDPNIKYSDRRNALRARNDESKAANPKTAFAAELVGGAVAPVPGGAAIKGGTALAKLGSAAKVGAKVGGLTALGNSKADLTKGEVGKAAMDTAIGAAGGAVIAPVIQGAGMAAKSLVKAVNPGKEEAIKAANRWVTKDIQGEIRGASTATARKQMGDDADNVAKIVLRDKPLREAIDNATEQSVDHLEHANGVVQERLSEVGKRLSPHWSKADAAIADAPLTSGQVTGHLDADAAALRATGRTTDAAEAKALEDISARLKTAKDWGAGSQIPSKLSDDAEAAIKQLEKFKKAASPAAAAKLDSKIAEIRISATSEGWNPNHKVPLEQLQKLWSDEAGIAYNNMGSINGTAAFERKLDVASHLRDLRDQVLVKAAQKDPAAIKAMRDDLSHYSALKRIEKVLDQRTNHAKVNGGGASIPEEYHRFIHNFKKAPVGTALGVAADQMVKFKKSIDTEAALRAIDGAKDPNKARAAWNALIGSKPGKFGAKVTAAIAAGIPKVVAMQAARAITQGARE